jgi:hypothetical protein
MLAGVVVPIVLLVPCTDDPACVVLIAALACSVLTAWLTLVTGTKTFRRWKTRLAEIAALSYLLARIANSPWYGAHDIGSMLLMVALAIAVVWDEIHDSGATPAARVRKLYYVIAFVLSALTLAWYAYELVQVLDRNPRYTLSNTTNTTNCKLTKVDSSTLFTSYHEYDTCPSTLWKYARVNVILMTQLYMLYTLTTTLKYDSGQNIPYLLARVFFECGLLTLAALWQFDIIPDCHVIKTPTLVLLLAAGVLRVLREYSTHAEPKAKTHAGDTASESNCSLLPANQPWGLRQRPLRYAKIKL